MTQVRNILAKWGQRSYIADDLAAPYPTVSGWFHRSPVPVWHWDALIASATRRGLTGVTLEALAEAHRVDRAAAGPRPSADEQVLA